MKALASSQSVKRVLAPSQARFRPGKFVAMIPSMASSVSGPPYSAKSEPAFVPLRIASRKSL